jgi:3-hydroxybutyrate dehydrogenase
MQHLAGKLALVTGGGRGIGAACARSLAAAGAKVIVCGRTQADLDAIAKDIGGIAIACDIADRRATDRMVRELPGRVDVLVNNAGVAESASLEKTSDELWDRIIELDATAPFRVTRALVPAMVKAGWGRVVNIASNAGVSGYGYSAAYCAAKHAMVGFTRALAIDLARSGVTINALCPVEAMSPQRRMIEPEEVAYAATMLCAEASRGIHGQTIVIDGGAILK